MDDRFRTFRQAQEAERIARETDLDYLRRTRPDMTDEARIAYLLWSGVAGRRIREVSPQK